MIESIRRISFSISPAILDDLGLDAALDWYCREFAASTGISCSFESRYDEAHISNEVRLDFFRICQEVLTNIRKYANPSQVEIKIRGEKKTIILSISDNATGAEHYKQSKVPGLLTMHERAALINAKCTIDHQQGKSNIVLVEVKSGI